MPAAAEVLELIHSEECAVLAVAEVVDIERRPTSHDEGDTLAGTLTLTRRKGDEPVTASRVERSVLIQADAELPLELDGDEDGRVDAGGVHAGELRSARAVGDEEAVRVPAVGRPSATATRCRWTCPWTRRRATS